MKKYMHFAQHEPGELRHCHCVIQIDVSPSMEEDDWPPSRLHGAVGATMELLQIKVNQYPEDRIGIVGFGGRAVVLRPLQRVGDGSGLGSLNAEDITTIGSTNITAGLNLAGRQLGVGLESDPSIIPQIILLTDGGHNTGPAPAPVAQALKAQGVVIDVIGIADQANVEEGLLRQIATTDPNGQAHYCFIGEAGGLIQKMRDLAHRHIRPL